MATSQHHSTRPQKSRIGAEPGTSQVRTVRDIDTPSLVDLLDTSQLLELQQGFTRLTGMEMTIFDANGRSLADRPPSLGQASKEAAGATSESADLHVELGEERVREDQYVAPIVVEDQLLGSIGITNKPRAKRSDQKTRQFHQEVERLGVSVHEADRLLAQIGPLTAPEPRAIAPFLDALTGIATSLCDQTYQLRHRVAEQNTVYKLSAMLTGHRNLQQVLDAAARSAVEVMQVKAASIRLLEDEDRELITKAVYNLSSQYLNKGPIDVGRGELYRRTLDGEVVYVEDMATDPRVLYPEDAKREGLVSILGAPIIHMDRPIGVIRLYTARRRRFSRFEVNTLRAVAQMLGTAIGNARLNAEHDEHVLIQRQLRLAADVQRRMLPATSPHLPPLDIAARYLPSLELGGDFYDLMNLEGRLGVAVGDVVGKGVAASLLMASVRASLRAYAQDVYDLDEIVSRVNAALTRDTLDNEFATLFYGVIDPASCRMTYCNAGHDPPLLLRDGKIERLGVGGMVVGIDAGQVYQKGLIDLKSGDLLLAYTDGLTDAQNFEGERFGRIRVIQAMRDVAQATARDAVNHILWEMRRFVGLNRSVDDITLVVIKIMRAFARDF